MVKKRNTGFTLIETTIAVAIVGILSTAAVPAYQYYVAQAQVSESMEMMQGVKSKVEQSVIKSNSCIPTTGATEQGKYGVLTISGTVKSTATQNPNTALKTGCVLSYKVNADSVSKSTAGKLVVGDLFNNGSISKSSSTTVEDRLLPKEFKTLTEGAITATGAPSAGANANITVKASSGSGGSGSGGTTTTVNDQLGNNLGGKPTTDKSSSSSGVTFVAVSGYYDFKSTCSLTIPTWDCQVTANGVNVGTLQTVSTDAAYRNAQLTILYYFLRTLGRCPTSSEVSAEDAKKGITAGYYCSVDAAALSKAYVTG